MHRGLVEEGVTPRKRLAKLLSARSSLERLVALNFGPRLFKFEHFYPIYAQFLARYRGRSATVLEIGLGQGGSLRLWRRYFGAHMRLVGLDVRPECARFAARGTAIEIGSQSDPAFLAEVARKHGPFDVVIDDGSHHYADQLATFRSLFDQIKPGGLYICEDICSSYWPEEFGGGLREPGSYIEFTKTLVDEVNGWFWRDDPHAPGSLTPMLAGLHFYPALVIVERRPVPRPVVLHVGREEAARPSA